MDNSSTISLQGEQLLDARMELVAPTTVAGTFYGIAFTLFCLYVHALAPQLRNGDRKRQAKFMLAYSQVIMICGLYYLIMNAWVTQDGYIKHSDYPEGPVEYTKATYKNNPVVIIGLICEMVIDTFTSAIQVWRVWVIWNATRYANLIIVLPVLCFVAFTTLRLRIIIIIATLPHAEIPQVDVTLASAEVDIQAVTSLLCTLLISLFLLFKQWQQRKLIGRSQGSTGYMTVVIMIIESYAVEPIWLIALATTSNVAVIDLFSESVTYVEIIAYLLVQYRVASGRAYESQKGQRNISSLRWNRSNQITTQFQETGEIQGISRLSAPPEASTEHRVSSMA